MPGVDDLRLQLSAWATGVAIIRGLRQRYHRRRRSPLHAGDVASTVTWQLTVGRQLISGGAARVLQLDGVNATVNIGKGFGISAYVGQPTAPPLSRGRGQRLRGRPHRLPRCVPGRGLRLRGEGLLEAVLRDRGGRLLHRDPEQRRTWPVQDLGVDARVVILPTCPSPPRPSSAVVEWRFADAQLGLSWQVLPTLELFVKRGAYSEPDLFLSRTSIFSVFAYTERTAVGGRGVLAGAPPPLPLRRVQPALGGRRQRRRGRPAGHLPDRPQVERGPQRPAPLRPGRTGTTELRGWVAPVPDRADQGERRPGLAAAAERDQSEARFRRGDGQRELGHRFRLERDAERLGGDHAPLRDALHRSPRGWATTSRPSTRERLK